MDAIDAKILAALQNDANQSDDDQASAVGLSVADYKDRVAKLEAEGVIRKRVALVDAGKVGSGVTVFVAITAPEHSAAWLEKFHATVKEFPEVQEFYRMSGQVDYLMRVVVEDIDGYDAFYKKLISTTDLKDVSSTFAMEQIKYTTAVPVHIA